MAALLQHLKHEEFGPLVAHGSYTMNLCSAKEETRANGLYIPVIAKRIHNEEKVLAGGLEGYAEYKQRIRYKVIPFVW